MNGIELLEKTATLGLSLQLKNGEMPKGHNGPYFETETPVRNTSHWCVIFAKAYKVKGEAKYKEGLERAANYLCSKDSRPNNFSFWHRDFKGSDSCNGVIGSAWTIEALCEASDALGEDKYYAIAEEVFFQHKFNKKTGVWNRLEIDGKTGRIDQTFNHQLWFAASASFLLKSETVNKEKIRSIINHFLGQLPNNLALFGNGLIYHPIIRKLDNRSILSDIFFLFYEAVECLLKKNNKKKMKIEKFSNIYWKSVGYHSFNTYAFAMLKSNLEQHSIWETDLITKLTDYILTEDYKKSLQIENYYGFPYNPPGFEVAFSLEWLAGFNEDELVKHCQYWVSEQLKYSYDFETGMMNKNNKDPNTLTARLYELFRLNQDILHKLNWE